MTTMTNATAIASARAAAEAALALLPSSTPLTVGTPSGDAQSATLAGQAVTARFSGAAQGEIVVVVGQDLADALAASPMGELDLAKAVAPAIEAAAATLGPVVVDPGQIMEPSVALMSLASKGDAVFVPLTDAGQTRALVAIFASPWPAGNGKPGEPRPYTPPPVTRNGGLDLLHDVEMEVTAELGRTRMSVRELLSLSPGAVVELDRAAGAPTDLLVNGRLIARGEVVVIDENFGIRITEIIATATERA
jgi:flagellar motor switch protein FliN/FliY